jgi:TonB family protein
MRCLTIGFLVTLAAIVIYCQDRTSPSSSTQEPTASQSAAREELNRAAAAYRAGNFKEAQQHSEKALSLDPSNRTAPIFLARTIHAQYKPRDDSPENVEMARAAIAAYQKILSYDPLNEEAYKAIAVLYQSIREEASLRDWILQRAVDSLVAVEKRAEAYAVLAGKDWDCSFKITELPDSKEIEDSAARIVYKKPESEIDFQKAKQCVARGLEMAENAIALDPDSESAWSYKTNLLIERSKLAEMEGRKEQKEADLQASGEAQAQTSMLADKRRRSEEGRDELEWQSSVDGGDLENLALKKPMPPYPPIARSRHISGPVRVQVLVDESGKVISARAVSGHALLQPAAVAAARYARFSPTYRDGQLVMVSGFLTYEFVAR